MTSRWFRVPETGDGTEDNPSRPKYSDRVNGYSANISHPDGAPKYVVRFYADAQTLDDIAAKSDAMELSSVPTSALNQIFGQTRTDTEWNNAFHVE